MAIQGCSHKSVGASKEQAVTLLSITMMFMCFVPIVCYSCIRHKGDVACHDRG